MTVKNINLLDLLIEKLKSRSTVDLITPEDPRFDNARMIYNRMHDCSPGLIVRTLDIDCLRIIMNFAFKHEITLAIRGGGHHIGGFSTCNDGIVIDFSTFKDIEIDSEKNSVSVSPGVILADIDRVLCSAGYVLPSGTVSKTGIAGLTLGGGIGWLIGQYGLTCDQLIGADVLLANGQLVKAEDPEHKDLLWALRGGGGNFGIVTKFRYQLKKLPKTICGMGSVAWEDVVMVMRDLVRFLTICPRTITLAPIFVKNKNGQPSMRIDFCCADGTVEDIARLTSLSKLINWSNVREWEFAAWQKEFDSMLLPPKRGYWKASYSEILTTDMIQALCEAFDHSPQDECTILIEHLHGAFKDYDQTTSAFPLRHAQFGILISARWFESTDDENNINWVRKTFNAIDPKGLSGTYVNYTSADDNRAVQTLIAGTLSKIARVKLHYDPDNLFKRNHNIAPIKLKSVS